MSKSNVKEKEMKNTPKQWNDTEVKLLKKWGEQAASYRVLHNRSYRKYKYLTALFTIPVIIISTVTGTANFSQGTIIQIYPNFELYLPLVIGALNLISGIITTIGQFLRVSELNEANRNASISYGKFARNISTELSLPPNERSYNGIDFIQICRNEMDRLIEQSPEINMKIINRFERNPKFKHIVKPELINISTIKVYEPTKEEKAKEFVADAATRFRKVFVNNKVKELGPNKLTSSKINELNLKNNVALELQEIKNKKIKKQKRRFSNNNLQNSSSSDDHVIDIENARELFETSNFDGLDDVKPQLAPSKSFMFENKKAYKSRINVSKKPQTPIQRSRSKVTLKEHINNTTINSNRKINEMKAKFDNVNNEIIDNASIPDNIRNHTTDDCNLCNNTRCYNQNNVDNVNHSGENNDENNDDENNDENDDENNDDDNDDNNDNDVNNDEENNNGENDEDNDDVENLDKITHDTIEE